MFQARKFHWGPRGGQRIRSGKPTSWLPGSLSSPSNVALSPLSPVKRDRYTLLSLNSLRWKWWLSILMLCYDYMYSTHLHCIILVSELCEPMWRQALRTAESGTSQVVLGLVYLQIMWVPFDKQICLAGTCPHWHNAVPHTWQSWFISQITRCLIYYW